MLQPTTWKKIIANIIIYPVLLVCIISEEYQYGIEE